MIETVSIRKVVKRIWDFVQQFDSFLLGIRSFMEWSSTRRGLYPKLITRSWNLLWTRRDREVPEEVQTSVPHQVPWVQTRRLWADTRQQGTAHYAEY